MELQCVVGGEGGGLAGRRIDTRDVWRVRSGTLVHRIGTWMATKGAYILGDLAANRPDGKKQKFQGGMFPRSAKEHISNARTHELQGPAAMHRENRPEPASTGRAVTQAPAYPSWARQTLDRGGLS